MGIITSSAWEKSRTKYSENCILVFYHTTTNKEIEIPKSWKAFC